MWYFSVGHAGTHFVSSVFGTSPLKRAELLTQQFCHSVASLPWTSDLTAAVTMRPEKDTVQLGRL